MVEHSPQILVREDNAATNSSRERGVARVGRVWYFKNCTLYL